MKTSLFGGRPLKLITRRRRQVEALSPPLKLFIAGEYLTVAAAPPSVFQITVAQSMPAPSQSATLQTIMTVTVAQSAPIPSQASTAQTVMPVVVGQSVPAPTQTITAEAVVVFQTTIAQIAPAPVQAIAAETQGGAKPKPGGNAGFSYYPPIYAIRTKGSQEALAPGQSVRVEYTPPRTVEVPAPVQATYSLGGVEYTLVPAQSIVLKSHRAVKLRDREEQDILALLASL